MKKLATHSPGFTLIEVVVAVAVLSFISLFTVQSIQRALSTKTKIQKDLDRTSTMRDALRVMERDINMAFNYRDVNTLLFNQVQEERLKAAQAKKGQNLPPNPAIPPPPQLPLDPAEAEKFKKKEVKIWTKFIGKKEELHFTSLSNVRMTDEQPISSQAEIGYHLKSCRRRSTQEQSSKCLWRRVSNYIHEDITRFGDETVLLENVTEFKLRYIGPGKDGDWTDTWVSDSTSGDDSTRSKFPFAVEITIETKDPNPEAKDKALRMTLVAAIRNPNNAPAETTTPNPQGAGPATK